MTRNNWVKASRILTMIILGSILGITQNVSAKEKNPSFLVLIGKQQEGSPTFRGHKRGAAKPHRILKGKLEKQGWTYEIAAFSPQVTMDYLKQFNVVLLGTGGEGGQKALWTKLSGKVGKLLLEYVKEGGGLLVMRNPGWQFGRDIDEFNMWLKPAGIKILNEQITDYGARLKTLSNASLFWSDNITPHPVTKGVEGFFYPDVYTKGYARYSDFSSPVKADKNWKILVRGSKSAKSYERKKAGKLQAENPGSYKSAPPILAVRDYGKGRIAVMPVASSCYWQDGYHIFWDSGLIMNGEKKGMKGSGERLMLNMMNYLAAPSLGKFGGYASKPPAKKAIDVGFARINWDRARYKDKYMPYLMKGLIGARSSLSSGKGRPEEFIAAAKKAGYQFIAFTETLEQMTEAKFTKLKAICAKASNDKFKAYQGLTYRDESGNTWMVFSDKLFWPQPAWFSKKKPGHLGVNNPLVRGWGFPPIIMVTPGKNPEPAYCQGNFKIISVYTYKNGKLLENSFATYLRLLNNSYHLAPVSVHITTSPAAVAIAAKTGFQSYIRWETPNVVEAISGFTAKYKGRYRYFRSSYISEGPMIEDNRILNFGSSDLAIKDNDRWRLHLMASSPVGLKEVSMINTHNGKPWRRYLLHGKKNFDMNIDGWHDRQYQMVPVVTDMQGKKAIGWEAWTCTQENSFPRCSDNYNTMPRGKWWGQPKELQNIHGFENYLAVRNFRYFGTPIFGGVRLDGESARPAIEYHPVIASRFGTIIDCLIDHHYPRSASGNLDKTDQEQVAVPNQYYQGKIRYTFFSPRMDSSLIELVEGKLNILKPFKTSSIIIFSALGRKQAETVCASGKGRSFLSGVLEKQKRFYRGTLPKNGYAALFSDSFKGSLGIVSLQDDISYTGYANRNFVNKALRASIGRGKQNLKKGDVIKYRYLGVISKLNPEPSNKFMEDIVGKLGLAGKPAYQVKPNTGKVLSTDYILRLEAANYAFTGTFSRARLPLNLPVLIKGLNPNWDAGILYKGRNRLLIPEWIVNDYGERYVEQKPRTRNNELYHFPVLADGTGFLQVDTELGKRNVFIGNLLTADNPDVKLLLLDKRTGKGKFEVHNPTDQDITCTVKPGSGFNLLGNFTKKVTVKVGSSEIINIK